MDREALAKIIEGCGVKLYDEELVNENGENIYRITITHQEGITLDKCTEVTQIISPLIDLEPPIEGQYRLEVSSPGVERKLTKKEHFQNSVGELVKIKATIDGEVRTTEGKLIEADDDAITIELEGGEKERISYIDIIKAKTYFIWS